MRPRGWSSSQAAIPHPRPPHRPRSPTPDRGRGKATHPVILAAAHVFARRAPPLTAIPSDSLSPIVHFPWKPALSPHPCTAFWRQKARLRLNTWRDRAIARSSLFLGFSAFSPFSFSWKAPLFLNRMPPSRTKPVRCMRHRMRHHMRAPCRIVCRPPQQLPLQTAPSPCDIPCDMSHHPPG
jgi:hypothetical protein